jgi:hypothetical protein
MLTDILKKSKTKQKQPVFEPVPGQDGSKFGDFTLTVLRDKKKAAELGYLAMSLTDPPRGAYWGAFNDRKVDRVWVNQLADKFEERMDNCTDATAIEAAVKKSWLKNANQLVSSVEGRSIQAIPLMEFTDEGIKAIGNKNLWMLGGNHRREAVIQYITEKTRTLEDVKKQVQEREEAEGEPEGDERDELDTLKGMAKHLEEILETSSLWAIRLYDRGA